jgi:DNA repair exonuclease SbcCD ATPase subunit
MPDSEKKDFLAEVLGLSKIEKAIEYASNKNKEVERELSRLDSIMSEHHSMAQSLTLLEPAMVDVSKYEKQIEDLVGQQEKIKDSLIEKKITLSLDISDKNRIEKELLHKIDNFKVEWKSEWDSLNTEASALLTEDTESRKVFDQNKNTLQATYKECLKRVAKIQPTLDSIQKLQKEVEQLEQNRCPTCKQQYLSTGALIESKAKEILSLQEQLAVLKKIDIKTEEIEAEIKNLKEFEPNPRIREVSNKINNLELMLKNKNLEIQNEYQDTLKGIEISIKSMEFEVKSLENLIKSLDNQISTARETVNFSTQENSRRQDEYVIARQELERVSKAIQDNTAKRLAEQEEFDTNLELQEFLGKKGFLGSIFDEILTELNVEINKILKSVANTSHVYFEFVSENVTQKGDTKKQIKPMLTINGYTASLYSGASGGMVSAIELAIDLSIMNVVSRRSNSNPGWLVLDESFDGMDVVSKETCLDILNKNSQDKLVLVIDHATEIKEAFSAFIDVEYRNGVSKIL